MGQLEGLARLCCSMTMCMVMDVASAVKLWLVSWERGVLIAVTRYPYSILRSSYEVSRSTRGSVELREGDVLRSGVAASILVCRGRICASRWVRVEPKESVDDAQSRRTVLHPSCEFGAGGRTITVIWPRCSPHVLGEAALRGSGPPWGLAYG